jgi:hypothetical protein
MKAMNMRFFEHDEGLALITEESRGHYVLRFRLTHQHTNDQGLALARFPAFPSVIGIGQTMEESAVSLEQLFRAYVVKFLDKNGMQKFEAKLGDLGFALSTEGDEVEAEDEPWEKPTVVCYQSAAA